MGNSGFMPPGGMPPPRRPPVEDVQNNMASTGQTSLPNAQGPGSIRQSLPPLQSLRPGPSPITGTGGFIPPMAPPPQRMLPRPMSPAPGAGPGITFPPQNPGPFPHMDAPPKPTPPRKGTPPRRRPMPGKV